MLSKREEIKDFRNSFQVCGAKKSIVVQCESIESMQQWLNSILIQKLATEEVIDNMLVEW